MTERSSPSTATGALHVDALPAGFRLGEFEIVSLLGVGGFGMVYKAFDHSLHRAVAVKEFMPAALVARADGGSLRVRSPADQAAFVAGLRSFVAEARLLAQFDHPSLVKVFRFWEAHDTAYMVMPLYGGMTLKQARTQMRTPPPEAWLRKVLWSVLGALRVLHGGQTLHRDVSPDNIFLQDAGPPVLLDLGAARHAINDRDRKHTAVLKVNYAPIEQYADGDTDLVQGPWSDLYAVGAVVHGCLCNDTPLPSTLRALRDRMVPFERVARTVRRQFGQVYSPAFVAAISQALALRPEDRPQSIDAFLQTMEMTSAPEGMEHFDFRAELGAIWVEPTDQPGSGMGVPTVDLSSSVVGRPSGAPVPAASEPTVVVAPTPGPEGFEAGDTVALDAGDTVVLEEGPDPGQARSVPHAPRASEHAGRSPPQRKKPALAWLVMGAAAMVVMVVVASMEGGRTRAVPPEDAIITELAEPVSAVATASGAAAQVPAPLQAGEGVSPPPASLDAAPGATPAFVPASDPRAASRVRRAPPVPAADSVQVVPEPVPVRSPPPPAPQPLVPSAPRAPTPGLCEDTNVLTRSMCMRDACRKPAFAARPECVEYRRRMEPLERPQLDN